MMNPSADATTGSGGPSQVVIAVGNADKAVPATAEF